MVKLFRTELTGAGRPVLLHGEIERGMLDKVDLMFYGPAGGVEGHASEEYREGYVVLTNFRLIWIGSLQHLEQQQGQQGQQGGQQQGPGGSGRQGGGGGGAAAPTVPGVPCHVPLPAVSSTEHKGGMLLKAARLKLMVRVDGASYPTPDPRQVASVSPLKLICRGSNPETLHSQLMAALQRQAWSSAPPGLLQQLHPVPALAPLAGGVVEGRVGPRPPGERSRGLGADAGGGGGGGGGGFQPDWAMVEGLRVIGYPRLHAVNAVVATRNAGVQQAVEWLLDHEGSPALDQPSPFLEDGSGPGSAAARSATGSSSADAPAGGDSFSNPLLAGLQQSGQQQSQQQQQGWEALGGGSSSGLGWGGAGGSGSVMGGGPGLGSVPAVLQAAPLRGGGVTAILQRVQDQVDATGSTMDAAFTDLSQLMRKAEEMVQLAQYFRERVAARKEGGSAEGDEELDAETALGLLELGIASPVTRETAGSLYLQELARQLADFLKAPMERAGGIMPLPDVYCLYNRARGTELISPDDLAGAVKLFPQVRAPFVLREYGSGVKVLQSLSHSDEEVCKRIAAMVAPLPAGAAQTAAGTAQSAAGAAGAAAQPAAQGPASASAAAMREGEEPLLATLGPSVTRVEVAVALGVPVAVASEHLRMAEARGVVCRDDGPEGLRYWRNFFPECAEALAAGAG